MNEKKIDYIRSKKFPMGVLDIVVFAAAIALTVALLLTINGKKGNGVEISYGGVTVTVSLENDCERRIGNHLTAVIKDGKCFVTESDCKNKTCVKTGKISRVGESIVCAQNGVVITVVGYNGLAGSIGQI